MKTKVLWISALALCALIALPLLAQGGSSKKISKGQGIQALDCGCGGQCGEQCKEKCKEQCGEKCDGKCKGKCGEKCDCGGKCGEKCGGHKGEPKPARKGCHESKQGCGGCGSSETAFGFEDDVQVIETSND